MLPLSIFAKMKPAPSKQSIDDTVNAYYVTVRRRMENGECRMENAECRMQNAECRIAECRIAECRMQNAGRLTVC